MNISHQYLAGLIDREGYFALLPHYQGQKSCHAVFKIAMRYDAKYILDEIRSVYGGSMEMRKGKENQNDSWCLVISGKKKLTILLNDILPYLILKKDIAELIHEYASMTNIHPLYRSNYEELDARRTEIFKLTKAITKKGKRVATTN